MGAERSIRSATANNAVIRRIIRESFWPALSAVLLVLPYHWSGFWPAAFIAFIPVFYACDGKTSSRIQKRFFVFGFLFWAMLGYWLNYVNVFGFFVLALYLAVYFVIFGAMARTSLASPKLRHTFYIAAYWVFLEYIRGWLISGFPWAVLAYSQWKNLWFIQAADLTGVYGISFIVLWTNVVLYQFMKSRFKGPSLIRSGFSMRHAVALGAVLALVLGYGAFQVSSREAFYKEERPKAKLRVSVLQGNIPQDQKWNARIKNIIFEKYKNLTLMSAMERADLIVWPETSFPGYLEDEPVMAARLRNLVRQSHTNVLVGAPTIGDLERELRFYNSAVLYGPNGEETKRYHKEHLVPFGEYIPMEPVLGILRNWVTIGHFSPGTEPAIFSVLSRYAPIRIAAKFSVLICYEDIFPELVRLRCKRGADFLVNITNDAWFGQSSAPYQHAQASVFRAVENRVPVVRAANTGFSCLISAEGRVLASVKSADGQEIGVPGFKAEDMTLRKGRSFYTHFGDLFFWMVLGLLWLAYRDKQKASGYSRV